MVLGLWKKSPCFQPIFWRETFMSPQTFRLAIHSKRAPLEMTRSGMSPETTRVIQVWLGVGEGASSCTSTLMWGSLAPNSLSMPSVASLRPARVPQEPGAKLTVTLRGAIVAMGGALLCPAPQAASAIAGSAEAELIS